LGFFIGNWNSYLGVPGNYGYYLKENDSSNQLWLQILDDHGDCLKDGDRIVFLDKDTLSNRDAYRGISKSGTWHNHMFLGSQSVGDAEIFQIEIPEEPVYTDWSSRLRYRD
jgi:sphingomyelin phosphodiesterase